MAAPVNGDDREAYDLGFKKSTIGRKGLMENGVIHYPILRVSFLHTMLLFWSVLLGFLSV